MIKLKELKLTNFRSWKKLTIKDFDTLGLVLIKGDNGSGKSAIRQAIEYLLIDEFSEPDIFVEDIPFNKGKNCSVYGKFAINDDVVEITKYRNHSKHKNATIVSFNGEEDRLTTNDRRETQRHIEDLFDIDRDKLFISTIFTKRSPSFPEASDVDRKSLIYKAKSLGEYEIREQRAKEKVKSLKEESNSLSTKVSNIEDLIASLEEEIKELEGKHNEYDLEKKKELKELKEELEKVSSKRDTSDLTSELLSLFAEIEVKSDLKSEEHISLEIRSLGKELADIGAKLGDIEKAEEFLETVKLKDLSKIKSKLSSLKELIVEVDEEEKEHHIEQIEELNIQRDQFVSALSYTSKKLDAVKECMCPILETECKFLEEEDKGKLQKELKRFKRNLNKIDAELSTTRGLLDDIHEDEKHNSETEQEITEQKYKLKEAEKENQLKAEKTEEYKTLIKNKKQHLKDKEIISDKLIYLKKERDNVKREVDKLFSLKDQKQEIEKEIERIEALNKNNAERKKDLLKRIEKLSNSISPYKDLVQEKQSKVKTLTKELKELRERYNEVIGEIPYYKFWVRGYGKKGLPNLKAEDFIADLEDETNRYLPSIFNKASVNISSQTQLANKKFDERISYKVIHPDRKVESFFAYSEGERHRIKIADMFATNKLVSNLDFVVLDEVLELSLDSKGKRPVMDFIRNKANEFGTVIVISHDDRFKDMFDNIIEISKTNGDSKMTKG